MLRLGNTEINALGNNINKAYLGSVEVFGNVFISLWQTTTANETITLPTPTNYRVDWGDGTVTTNTNSHEYLTANQYTIKISGEVTDFAFVNGGDKLKILEISKYGGSSYSVSSFHGCDNLDITETKVISINSGSIGSLFRDCSSLVYNSSINLIQAQNSTGINSMFRGCTLFNQDLTFDASSSILAQDFLRDATNFNSTVSINLASATSVSGFFANCVNYNQNINLNTPLSTNFSLFLNNCTNFNSQLLLDTSSANDMSNMFLSSSNFNQPLNFDTSNVTSMVQMFRDAISFNQSLNFDTSKVESMVQMFWGSTSFNQDISSWSFFSVTNMSNFMILKGAEYDTNYMDNLYIKLDQDLVFANMVNVNIGFGSINYTSAGATARASLVSKGFIITSGIQV